MKNNQTGRSMVEMLGVLAIVGVLSAGALKGYSAAMFKYKMNQTIDIFNGVLQRFIELESKGWGNGEINTDDFVAYGLLDECQEEDNYCRLPLGKIFMDFGYLDSVISGEFEIYFTSSKECIAFASAGWENAVPIEWMMSGGVIFAGNEVIYDPSGDQGEVITQVSMSDIIKGCQICNENVDACVYSVTVREGF